MNKRDLRWILYFAGILALATSLPYLVGFSRQGADWHFSGFVFGVNDGNSYIAKMLSGSQGDWLFRTPYSSLDQRGVIAFLPYILIGKLAAGAEIHLQLLILFHLFRVLTIPLVVLATYRFVSIFIGSVYWRRWATVLATCGGGLGWLLILAGQDSWQGSHPLDIYSPETFGFLAVYGLPHLALARALLLLGMLFYVRASESPRLGWAAGACFLVLALVQPLSVITAFAVIALHQLFILVICGARRSLVVWKPWLSAAVRCGVVASPLVLYLGVSFTHDPFLKKWTDQNLILSPHPSHYFFAYGVLAIPAACGVVRLLRLGQLSSLLPVSWVVAFPFLAYAPYNLQRRLPEGVWVALVLLAMIGFSEWLGERRSRKRLLIRLVFLSSLISSMLLIVGGLQIASSLEEPVFRSAEEVTAFTLLSESVEPGSIVLTGFETGNAMPAWAPVRVVIGHGPESADLELLQPRIEALYRGTMSDNQITAALDAWNVDYVWLGPHETALGSWDPSTHPALVLVMKSGGHKLYKYASNR